MMRLFVALNPPAELTPLLHSLAGSIPGARRVAPEQLHMTLKFIGDVDEGVAHDIDGELASISFAPFTMRLKGTGHFPPRGAPRILWAGGHPTDILTRLHKRIDQRLSHCGIPRERRKFHPHITLARLKTCRRQHVAQVVAANALFETPPFSVTSFQLYRSTLTPKGALHDLLESYPLNG